MADLVMDNPLASQPQLNKVAQDTIDCILDLKREFDETKMPVNDDNQILHRFCAKLEHLLKAEMKEKTTLLGRRKEYYDFFCDCLSSTKGLNDGIKFVKSTGEYKTATGRGRAFIRFSLVHQRLADTIQQCVMNGKVTSDWYTTRSVWLNHIQKNAIITSLYELNEINFDLLPRGYDLDNAWPSFRRKTHGMGIPQGNWNPPSRASSYTSIVSLPGQEPLFTRERRDTTSTTVSEAEYERDLSLAESEKSQLSHRVEELEQESLSLAETVTAREHDLTDLGAELAKARERCRMQETEMGLKEKAWNEKEAHLQSERSSQSEKIQTLEDKMDQLRNKLLSSEKAMSKREEDYRNQLQVKESKTVKLEAELKSAQQMTENVKGLLKTQEDVVSSLQAKLSSQEGKSEDLLQKMEAMVLNKDSEVGSQLDAASKLHEVLDNLKASERENVELRANMDESSRKCASLEENLVQSEDTLKTTTAALEEVKSELSSSHSKEKSLQEEVQQTTQHLEEMGSELTSAKSRCEQLAADLAEKTAAVDNLSEELADFKTQNGELSKNLIQQEEKHNAAKHMMEKTEGLNKDLREREKQLERELSEKDTTIDQLKSELDTLTSEVTETQAKATNLGHQLTDRETALRTLVSQLGGLLDNSLTEEERTEMINRMPDEDTRVKLELFRTRLDSEKSSSKQALEKVLSLEEEVSLLKEESSEKGRQLHSGRLELDQLKEMNKALENLETDARSRSEKDSSLLQLKDNRIQGLEDQVTQKEELITQLKSEVFSKSEDIAKKNQELAEISVSVQKTHAELQTSSHSKQETDKELKSLMDKCSMLEQSLSEEKTKTNSLNSENAKLSEDLQVVGKNLTDSQSKLEQFQQSSAIETQAITDKLEKQVAQIQLKYEEEKGLNVSFAESEVSLKKEIEECKTEQISLTAKCNTLSLELESVREQLISAHQENQGKQKQISDLEIERNTMTEKLKQAEGDLKVKSEDLLKHIDKISEKDTLIKDFEETIETLKSEDSSKSENVQLIETELEDLRLKHTEMIVSKDREIRKLETLVESWKSAVENEKEASVLLREEREDLNARLEKFEQDKEKLREEMSSLQDTAKEKDDLLEVTKLQVEGDRQALKNQAEVQEQEIQALKFQLSSQQIQHEQALGKYSDHESDISTMRDRLSEQEGLIEQLEGEMWAIKQAREEEQRQQKQEVEDVKTALLTKGEEFTLLSSKLVQISTKLADEQNQVSILQHEVKVKEELESLLQHGQEESAALKKDNSILKSDIVQLKKKLIRLIKEKDALWQKTDSLVYEQRIHATEKWMDDSKVTNCMGCRIEFSFTTRKHHCRLCGRIFCWNCSNNWVMTTHSNKKARVCNGCYIKQRDVDGRMDSSLVGNDSDDDEAGFAGSLRRRSAVPEDTTSQSSTSQDVSSLDISGLLSADTDSLASGDLREVDSPDSMADGASGNETDDNKRGRKIPGAAENKDFSSTTDELTSAPGASPPDESGKEDPFHVISEEEIVKSLSGSLSSPPKSLDTSMLSSMVISVEDLQKGHVNRDNEVWLKAGRRFAVPILIDTVGVVLCWEFSTQPKDIGFSATYGEEETTPSHEVQVLIQPCKCNSHKQAVRGELTAKKKGIYTLLFDNTYSRFTTKKLSYSLYLKPDE